MEPDIRSALPSFGDFVALRWVGGDCEVGAGGDDAAHAYEEARDVAESFLFDIASTAELRNMLNDLNPSHFPGLPVGALAGGVDAILEELELASREYFGRHWDRVDEVVEANEARLDAWKAARLPCELEPGRGSSNSLSGDGSPSKRKRREDGLAGVREVTDLDLPELLRRGVEGRTEEKGAPEEGEEELQEIGPARLVLLEVYSRHCPQCVALLPGLRRAAQRFSEDPRVLVARIDGPANPECIERLDVQCYPTFKLIDRDTACVIDGPVGSASTARALISLISTHLSRLPPLAGPSPSPPKGPPRCQSSTSLGSSTLPNARRRCLSEDQGALDKIAAEVPANDTPPSFEQLAVLKDEMACSRTLASRRLWASATEIFRALGCYDEASCRARTRTHSEDDPPHMILLGGGMGSGKTSIKSLVTKSAFWQRYGSQVVQVEADVFKDIDPVFQLLKKAKLPEASKRVHHYSTQAAEELFLSAVRYRRDVVFDSTLAWEPFLRQTLRMVKDAQHRYKRGPGYVTRPDGSIEERYWEVERDVETGEWPVPYRVELVGVYVRPEVAVRRAIVRRLLTGRDVPVRDQLRSHKMFASNFERYAPEFDTVALYDNNRSTLCGVAEPRLIAKKDVGDSELVVLDPAAYESFRAVGRVNIDASCVDELYAGDGVVDGVYVVAMDEG